MLRIYIPFIWKPEKHIIPSLKTWEMLHIIPFFKTMRDATYNSLHEKCYMIIPFIWKQKRMLPIILHFWNQESISIYLKRWEMLHIIPFIWKQNKNLSFHFLRWLLSITYNFHLLEMMRDATYYSIFSKHEKCYIKFPLLENLEMLYIIPFIWKHEKCYL